MLKKRERSILSIIWNAIDFIMMETKFRPLKRFQTR